MSIDRRPVRFVCTGRGFHPRRVIMTLRLTNSSVEHVSSVRISAPFNRPSIESMRRRHHREDGHTLPDFDLMCLHALCGVNPRASAAKMREIMTKLLSACPNDTTVQFDISSRLCATLF